VNPLLLLAAAVAVDRMGYVSGMRPLSQVYADSKLSLRRLRGRRQASPPVVAPAPETVAPSPGVTSPSTLVSPQPMQTTAAAAAGGGGGGVGPAQVPTTPVVKVTTITGEGQQSVFMNQGVGGVSGTETVVAYSYSPSANPAGATQELQQRKDKERANEMESQGEQAQPRRIPISGAGELD